MPKSLLLRPQKTWDLILPDKKDYSERTEVPLMSTHNICLREKYQHFFVKKKMPYLKLCLSHYSSDLRKHHNLLCQIKRTVQKSLKFLIYLPKHGMEFKPYGMPYKPNIIATDGDFFFFVFCFFVVVVCLFVFLFLLLFFVCLLFFFFIFIFF